MLEQTASVTPEQVRTLSCLREWLEIRSRSGYELPVSVEEFWDAVESSALLCRLLAGKAPLLKPPPLSFGHPWYELVEKGFSTCEVSREAGELTINGTRWEIADECRDGEYLVRAPGNSETYLVWKVPALSIRVDDDPSWIIERVWSPG